MKRVVSYFFDSSLPSDTRALRQSLWTGAISIVMGFVACLIGLSWLINHAVDADAHWWEILHMCITALMISGLGGLATGAATVTVLNWVHYRCGMYRCRFCDSPLKSMNQICGCSGMQALRAEIHARSLA
jgi:hypothetical protein